MLFNQALSESSKKAVYGVANITHSWETERDNALKSLKWTHDKIEYRLLPCPGSPCLWSVVSFRPGDDPNVKASMDLTGWQHHIDAITKALLLKYVMKRSGLLPYGDQGEKMTDGASESINFLASKITPNVDGTIWCDQDFWEQMGLSL